MNKLLKLSLTAYLLITLNGCGVEKEESVEDFITVFISHYTKELPTYFQVHFERFSVGEYFEYGLKSETKELIFSEKVEKNSQSLIKCQEYENEESFVTYDCNITTDKNNDIKKTSFILEKNIKYNFYSKSSIDGNDSVIFELLVSKEN